MSAYMLYTFGTRGRYVEQTSSRPLPCRTVAPVQLPLSCLSIVSQLPLNCHTIATDNYYRFRTMHTQGFGMIGVSNNKRMLALVDVLPPLDFISGNCVAIEWQLKGY